MKNQILIIALLLISSYTMAQTKVTKDAQGNYIQITKLPDSVKAVQVALFTDTKGKVYQVYKSINNKIYYNHVSAKGTTYKVYLKE